MNTIECIKSRRSRRLFLDKEVSNELIQQILQCAVSAPSSMNCQPWHFVVLKDKGRRVKLADLKTEGNQQHILTASATIIVCVDMEKSPSRFIEDGITATQNILLAVHELGLGSVYVTGCNPTDEKVAEEIREILSLPDNILPITILPIGYVDPSEVFHEKDLVDLNGITHYDKW